MTAVDSTLADLFRDRYVLERELGRGGMATVYLARDLRHKRQVALKVLRPDLSHSLGSDRFLREIETAARLTHPHILPLHDSGEAGGLLYYVMPFVQGESLRDRLAREVQLSVGEALRIVHEVADALSYAHSQGIVHRDIKPENILLMGGHALVADFGIARALGQAGGERLTETGVAIGTASYMAPEQASGGPVDGRSDVYALGCVLYEMLAGEPPFTGRTAQAVIAKRLTGEVPDVRVLRPAVPLAMHQALAKALAPTPADRWPTAEAFDAALEDRALANRAVTSPAVATPQTTTALPRRRVTVVGAVTLAGLLLASAILFAWQRGRAGAEAGSDLTRLVVLPFENLGRAEDEYFAEGMADELNTRLASLGALAVIDRQSAVRYKGSDKSVAEIGRELGVEYVLAGSVRWEKPPAGASRVRISPRLVRVSDGSPVWAKGYDAVLTSVFELQADVARQVAEQLDVALAAPERRALEARPTENLAAYDAFLRGRAYGRRADARSVEGWLEDVGLAVGQYTEAIRLDSTFLQAYTSLAIAHLELYDLERSAARAAAAKDAIDRAIDLNAGSPEVRLALGKYQLEVLRDTTAALRELAAAEQGKPNDADLLATMAEAEWDLRADTSAVHHQARAVALDPHSVVKTAALADMYQTLRRYDEAGRLYDRAIRLGPGSPGPYIAKARLHLLRDGDVGRARGVVRDAARHVDSMTLVETAVTTQATWFALGMLDESYQRALLALPAEVFGMTEFYGIAKGYTYRARGDSVRARAYYDTALVAMEHRLAKTGHPWDMVTASWPHAVLGHRAKAYELMRKGLAGLTTRDRGSERIDENLARLYVLAGDYDAAVAELTKGGPLPDELTVPWLRADPFWDPLRVDPRFRRLVGADP